MYLICSVSTYWSMETISHRLAACNRGTRFEKLSNVEVAVARANGNLPAEFTTQFVDVVAFPEDNPIVSGMG
jgi:hypothetical protein